MTSLLQLLLGILIFSFIIFGFSLVISKYFSYIKYPYPLAFLVILSICQFYMYFFSSQTYDKEPTTMCLKIMIIILLVISIIFVYLFRHQIKLLKIKVSKKERIILLFSLLFSIIVMIFFFEVGTQPSDSMYYMGYITDNATYNYLNSYNPFDGFRDFYILNIYRYQSFYQYISSIFNIIQANPYLFIIWFMPLFLVCYNLFTIFNIMDYLKLDKWIYILFVLPLIFGYDTIYNSINGSIFKLSLFSYLFIVLAELLKNKDSKNSLLLLSLIFSGFALHSSFLFQIIVIFMAVGLLLKKDDLSIFTYIICTFPIFQYIIYFFELDKYIIILYLLYFSYLIILKFNSKINKVLYFLIKIVIALLSFLILLYGIIKIINGDMSGFEAFMSQILAYENMFELIYRYLIYFLILIFLLLNIRTNIAKYILLVIILVYNPISYYFISEYMTGEVYFRIREVVFQIPYIIILLLSFFSVPKIVNIILCVFSIVSCVFFDYKFHFVKYENIKSLIYRTDYDIVDISMKLNDYELIQEQNFPVRTISGKLTSRFFLKNVAYVYSYGDQREFQINKETEEDNLWLLAYLLNNSKNIPDAVNIASLAVSCYDVKLLIVDKKQINELYNLLDEFYDVIIENDSYYAYLRRGFN